MPTASIIRPPVNYTPPVNADTMHTEGVAGRRQPKISRLMSLVIPPPEESPPHYTLEPITFHAAGSNTPYRENRKRRIETTYLRLQQRRLHDKPRVAGTLVLPGKEVWDWVLESTVTIL